MSTQIPGELVHLVGQYMALRFTLPQLPDSEDVAGDELYAMFAVDKSGSMSGSPINDARGAAESLVNKFRRMDVPVTVFPFNNHADQFSSDQIGYDIVVEKIQALRAGGGTIFRTVINKMTEIIIEKSLKNVFCVWLTDGQDNQGLNTLIPVMDNFKSVLESSGVSIGVHCIGFSSNHDATLLTRLSQSGTRPGTFQYVPEGGRIPVAVNNVYELAFQSATWARLIGAEGVAYKIHIEKSVQNTAGGLSGLVYVSENDLQDCKIQMHKGSEIHFFDLELTRGETNDMKELVNLVTTFVASKVSSSLEGGNQKAGLSLYELSPLLEEMERRLRDLLAQAMRLRPYRARALKPFFDNTLLLIEEYYRVNNQLKGKPINNVQLASLNGLANKILLTKSLEKKIIKETGPNFRILLETDSIIDQIVNQIKTESLLEQYGPSIQNIGKCQLSDKNWVELVAQGNCLCITFQVSRPQNLMGDPLDLKIVQVNTTLVSHDQFLKSPFFLTKAGQIIQGQGSYVHGTSPAPGGQLVNGFPNEKINAIFPVFISPEHWQIAQHRIMAMIGYDITVDILGFSKEQLLVFPFLLMARALQQAESQESLMVYSLVRDTCFQIYRENKQEILPGLEKLVANIHDPKLRVVKSVPVAVCQLFCASNEGDISDFKHVLPYLLEDAIRTNYPNPETKFHQLVMKLFAIDPAPFFEPIKQALLNFESSYAERFRVLLGGGNVQDQPQQQRKVDTEINTEKFQFKQRIQALSNFAEGEIGKLLSCLNSSEHAIGTTAKLLNLFDMDVKNLDSLGLDTLQQKLALIIQTSSQSKENDRALALEQGKVVNIFDQASAVGLIQQAYSDAVNREVLSFKSQLISQLQGKEIEQRAALFANTESLEEAAGCIWGIHQGDSHFSQFFKGLFTPGIPHVIEKIKMITHGQFQGVALIKDNIRGSGQFVVWNPSNKRVYNLWKAHEGKFDKEEWKLAFPAKAEYFEHQYARQQGDFVPYSKPRSNCVDPRHWEGKPEKSRGHRGGRGLGRGRVRGRARGRGRRGRRQLIGI